MSRESAVANGDGESPIRKGRRRLWLGFVALIAATGVFFILRPIVLSLTKPLPEEIVGELPNSARLDHYAMVRFGFDYCHLFEFSCSDGKLRDTLVRRWRLRDLTGRDEQPVSFAEYKHPTWWTPDVPPATRKYGRRDEKNEEYWSLWEHSQAGRLYVEVGRW